MAELGEIVVEIDQIALGGLARGFVVPAAVKGHPPPTTFVAATDLIPGQSVLHGLLPLAPEGPGPGSGRTSAPTRSGSGHARLCHGPRIRLTFLQPGSKADIRVDVAGGGGRGNLKELDIGRPSSRADPQNGANLPEVGLRCKRIFSRP